MTRARVEWTVAHRSANVVRFVILFGCGAACSPRAVEPADATDDAAALREIDSRGADRADELAIDVASIDAAASDASADGPATATDLATRSSANARRAARAGSRCISVRGAGCLRLRRCGSLRRGAACFPDAPRVVTTRASAIRCMETDRINELGGETVRRIANRRVAWSA